MTERSRTPVARLSRGRTLSWVLVLSLVVALAIAGGLALQMAVGRDPALGPKRIAATAQPVNVPTPTATAPAPAATPAPAPAPVPTPVQTTTS